MNKLLFAILTGLVFSLFSITATVQAQEINHPGLSGKEKGIVAVLAERFGQAEADNANQVLLQVLAEKKR
jgi:hypothetical protein